MFTNKRIIEQYKEHPNRCPWCRSKKIRSVGEVRDNMEPMYCNNCARHWETIRDISGIAFDGFTFLFDQYEYEHPTMNLYWFDVQHSDHQDLFCTGCKDWFKSLYCLDTTPETAAENSDALCWDCAGVHFHFPANQIIEIPQAWV